MPLDLFFCLGGNFLRNLPEPDYISKALSNVPLRVHQDIILTDQMFVDPGSDGVLSVSYTHLTLPTKRIV